MYNHDKGAENIDVFHKQDLGFWRPNSSFLGDRDQTASAGDQLPHIEHAASVLPQTLHNFTLRATLQPPWTSHMALDGDQPVGQTNRHS